MAHVIVNHPDDAVAEKVKALFDQEFAEASIEVKNLPEGQIESQIKSGDDNSE